MLSRLGGKSRRLVWGTGAVLFVGLVAILVLAASDRTPVANTAGEARQQYAALYQAAWRQDDGRSPTLVTATLLVPPTSEALGRDNARSNTEEQLWRIVQPLDTSMIPVVMTLDSVADAVPDSVIQNGLVLSAPGVTLSFDDWKPMVAPTRVVNSSTSITSQMGVAIFRAAGPIDWDTLGALKLTLSGMADQPDRIFRWIEPKVLLQL